jgi:hypothetical protein
MASDFFQVIKDKKRMEIHPIFLIFTWSGRQDLNLRPSAPKADAIPSYATSRNGAPHKNRTRNLQIRSLTLYPVELGAQCTYQLPDKSLFGGSYRI